MSSLGWLTESAFIPKESKKIAVSQNSALVDLKAKILEEKAKLNKRKEAGFIKPQASNNKKPIGQNIGIEERIKRDQAAREQQAGGLDNEGKIDHKKIEIKLAEKARKYEMLVQDKKAFEKGKGHLVDYEQKRWNQQPEQKSEHTYLSEMNQMNDLLSRERQAWEREALNEINKVDQGVSLGSVVKRQADSATAMIGVNDNPLVKQQWDNILTHNEKQQLSEVVMDKDRQKELQMLAKRKRDMDRDDRQNKINELKKRRKM